MFYQNSRVLNVYSCASCSSNQCQAPPPPPPSGSFEIICIKLTRDVRLIICVVVFSVRYDSLCVNKTLLQLLGIKTIIWCCVLAGTIGWPCYMDPYISFLLSHHHYNPDFISPGRFQWNFRCSMKGALYHVRDYIFEGQTQRKSQAVSNITHMSPVSTYIPINHIL